MNSLFRGFHSHKGMEYMLMLLSDIIVRNENQGNFAGHFHSFAGF